MLGKGLSHRFHSLERSRYDRGRVVQQRHQTQQGLGASVPSQQQYGPRPEVRLYFLIRCDFE